MDDQPRPEASAEPGEVSKQPLSSENERSRPRAEVLPNILAPHQVIRPMVRNNPIIQVALLSFNDGLYHIERTSMLVIDPVRAGARDPSLPIPVVLPTRETVAGVATILLRDMVDMVVPNISRRHYRLVVDLEREEGKIFEVQRQMRTLERLRRMSSMMRATPGAPDPAAEPSLLVQQYENLMDFVEAHHHDPHDAPAPDEPRRRNARRSRARPSREPQFSCLVELCRRFLFSLRVLSMACPRLRLERAIQLTIQLLVHDVFNPLQFCRRVERLLGAPAQPHYVRFLEESIGRLRQAMYLKLATVVGIDRPSRRVAFPIRENAVNPSGSSLRTATVAPRQEVPLSTIPYNQPLQMDPIHVSRIRNSVLPSLTRITPKEGDLNLYNPHVGYVHMCQTPHTNSFQIGNATNVQMVQVSPNQNTNR